MINDTNHPFRIITVYEWKAEHATVGTSPLAPMKKLLKLQTMIMCLMYYLWHSALMNQGHLNSFPSVIQTYAFTLTLLHNCCNVVYLIKLYICVFTVIACTRLWYEPLQFRYSIQDGVSSFKVWIRKFRARFYAKHVKRLVDVLIKVCFVFILGWRLSGGQTYNSFKFK